MAKTSQFEEEWMKHSKEPHAQIHASSGYRVTKPPVDQAQSNMEPEELVLSSAATEMVLDEATLLPLVAQQLQMLYPLLEPNSADFRVSIGLPLHYQPLFSIICVLCKYTSDRKDITHDVELRPLQCMISKQMLSDVRKCVERPQ